MADSVANIKVEIDTDEAQKNLDQLYETQKKLIDEMKGVDEGSDAYNDLAKTLEDTNKQIGGMERNIKTQTMGLNEMDDITSAATRTVSNLGLAETKLGKVINTVGNTIGNLKSTTDAYRKAQEAANVATNAGTTAMSKMNKVAKRNIFVAAVAVALPLIITLIEKIKKADSETLTLEDRLDAVGKKYERINGMLSKIGADEIILLRTEQHRLSEEIELTRTHYANMMNKGEKVTEKMWGDLNSLEQKYKDMGVQIKYMNEDIAAANELLGKQVKIEKDLTKNQSKITILKKRLELEKEKNGVTQKSLDLERDIYNLEMKEITLQEEKLDNEEQALDTELARYKEHIDKMKGVDAVEKETAKSNKEKEISLQKQNLENQRLTLETQKQLNILEKQVWQMKMVKQAASSYSDFVGGYYETAAEYSAKGVKDFRDINAFYRLQSDVLKDSSEEMRKTIHQMDTKVDSQSVDKFFKNYKWLLDSMTAINNGEADKTLLSMKGDIEARFKKYTEIFMIYAQQSEKLRIKLENNINTSFRAWQNAGNNVLTLYSTGLNPEEFGMEEQIKLMEENLKKFEDFRVIVDKNKEDLTADDKELLDKYELWNLYDDTKAQGKAGLFIVDNYIDNLKSAKKEFYMGIEEINVAAAQSTLEFMSNAIMLGTASLNDYREEQKKTIAAIEQQEVAMFESKIPLMRESMERQNEERRKAGLEEIDIETRIEEEKQKIHDKYDQQRIIADKQVNMVMLQQGVDFVQNMNSVFADLFEDNKDAQKASIVVDTLANSAMAFGSTFANAKGELWVKAAQAAAASAAVMASGISAYRKVDAANQSTTLEGAGGGSSSVRTGGSSVSSTIVERQIRPMNVRSSSDTVLVLSDVEYKQRQQKNIDKITVI